MKYPGARPGRLTQLTEIPQNSLSILKEFGSFNPVSCPGARWSQKVIPKLSTGYAQLGEFRSLMLLWSKYVFYLLTESSLEFLGL